jgi:hypothetical protein
MNSLKARNNDLDSSLYFLCLYFLCHYFLYLYFLYLYSLYLYSLCSSLSFLARL